jgi:hypothetical protein
VGGAGVGEVGHAELEDAAEALEFGGVEEGEEEGVEWGGGFEGDDVVDGIPNDLLRHGGNVKSQKANVKCGEGSDEATKARSDEGRGGFDVLCEMRRIVGSMVRSISIGRSIIIPLNCG